MSLDQLPPRIKGHILAKANDGPPKETSDNRFGVTELLGCKRRVWLRRRRPLPVTLDSAFYFWRGNVWDEEITSKYPRNQVRVTHRIMNPSITISGKIDFIDDDGAVADLKTTDKISNIVRYGPKENNVAQVLFYCWCEGVNKGRLYYLSMGDVLSVEIEAGTDRQLENLEVLENSAIEIYKSLLKDEPPPVDTTHTKDFWECRYKRDGEYVYCEYYEACHGGTSGKSKVGKDEPILLFDQRGDTNGKTKAGKDNA